jgi:hypothetical protein
METILLFSSYNLYEMPLAHRIREQCLIISNQDKNIKASK